jgi:hypothetical protein
MPRIEEVAGRNLVFVSGKGGVGKTVVSQAIALSLSQRGKRVLWVAIEDPLRPPGELLRVNPDLWNLNCEASTAFEEYIGLKLGGGSITRLFLGNKLIRYLAKAAPGIHELVLLGKIWYERKNYDHVVVDMPSTGYGLAMFHSTANFAKLFRGGPITRDAEEMIETFKDSKSTGHVIVALPEEMPLQEALELDQFLQELFPGNRAAFVANRLFPGARTGAAPAREENAGSPVAKSASDYILRRLELEEFNLRRWRDEGLDFLKLPYLPPPFGNRETASPLTENDQIARKLAEYIQ